MSTSRTPALDRIYASKQKMQRARRQQERVDRLMRPVPRLDRLLGVDPGLSRALTQTAVPSVAAAYSPPSSVAALAGVGTFSALAAFRPPSLAAVPALKVVIDGLASIRSSPMVKSYRAMSEVQEAARIDRIVGVRRAGAETTTSILLGHVGLAREAYFLRKINAVADVRRYSGMLGSYSTIGGGVYGPAGLVTGQSSVFRALEAQAKVFRSYRTALGNLHALPWNRWASAAEELRKYLDSPEVRAMVAEELAESEPVRSSFVDGFVQSPSHVRVRVFTAIMTALNEAIRQAREFERIDDPLHTYGMTLVLLALLLAISEVMAMNRRDD